jgi:hypothetical protein
MRVELLLLQGSGTMIFETGDEVPSSGIYQVLHKEHRLPREVTLVGGKPFPPCSRCQVKVGFDLLRSVAVNRYSIVLHSIPVLHDEPDDLEQVS